ncbi:MAG: peptidoglycan-binding protein [bacterium]
MFAKLKLSFVIFLAVTFLGLPFFASASIATGTIDGTYKYAWSENMGWLNFGASSGNVLVTDTAITGYAWSSEYGWINLAPSTSGVINNSEGTLSGSAWGEGVGWINFSGVTIDDNGYFTGYATGDESGQVSFNCSNTSSCSSSDFKVRTDWRKASLRGGGSTASINPVSPAMPASSSGVGFNVNINNNSSSTNSQTITLKFNAGPDVKKMAISNTPDFKYASLIPYEPTKKWTLTPGDGNKTVYVKFYTQYGVSSEVVSNNIKLNQVRIATGDPTAESDKTSFAEGDLVKKFGDPAVYLIQWGRKRPIISAEVFLSNGFSWNEIIEVNDLSNYSTAFPVTMPLESSKLEIPTTTPEIEILPEPEAPTASSDEGVRIASATGVDVYKKVLTADSAFTKNLNLGDKDEEVKALQKFLNKNGFTVAESGAGSLGNETNFFGNLTAAALVKFQESFSEQILSPAGLAKGTGYFGPSTKKFVNSFNSTSAIPAEKAKPDQVTMVLGEKITNDLPSGKFEYELGKGMNNYDVERLQILLASIPYVYPEALITGYFGNLTETAVKRFQLKYNITIVEDPAFGYVGSATRDKLLEIFGE